MTTKTLHRLSEIVSSIMYAFSADEIETILQRIAHVARELTETKYSALGIPDEEGGVKYFKVSGMPQTEVDKIAHPPVGKGLIGAIMRERKTIRLEAMQDDPRSVGFPAHHPPMYSLLGVPIQMGQQLFGMLYLCDKTDGKPFTDEDQILVETLATYAALALATAEIHQQQSQLRVLQERERIGMELHDGVIQWLYGIGMQLQLLQSNEPIAGESLQPILQNLDQIIEDIRGFILRLKTSDETSKTIRETFIHILKRLHIPDNLYVIIDAPEVISPFAPAMFESICLISQEILSNTVRHANASEVEMHFTINPADCVLTIRDNGIGFDMNNPSSGLGLQNIHHRARRYGGEVSINSELQNGTEIIVRIPL